MSQTFLPYGAQSIDDDDVAAVIEAMSGDPLVEIAEQTQSLLDPLRAIGRLATPLAVPRIVGRLDAFAFGQEPISFGVRLGE